MPTPYPNVPASHLLARYEFTTPSGTGKANLILGHKFDPPTWPADVAMLDQIKHDYETIAFIGVSNQVSFTGIHAVINRGGVLSEADSSSAAVAGGIASDPVPANTSVLVHKATGLIGRNHRGRLYVPGIAETWMDGAGSNLTAPHLATLETAFLDWIAQLITDKLDLAVLHRNPATTPDLVTDVTVRSLVATQRRRLRKVAHR